MVKIGVVLSGCGVNDGAEIHESVIALLALDRANAEVVFMAPNKDQMDVVNHLAGEPSGESRNVLVESARIARGNIVDVATVQAADLDGVIVPGGFGAIKNLCDFATQGDACQADTEVARLLVDMHEARKPIGAICIAPALVARVLGEHKPTLPIGTDAGTAGALEKMGARHKNCDVRDCVVDAEKKIVTTPAFMLAGSIKEAADGIEKLVTEVVRLAGG